MISVLYVDDEPALVDLCRRYLERMGDFSVDTAFSPEEGMGKLGSATYDAVVSDYQMPGMDGIGFLREVRATWGDLPFILFTGRGREEIVIQAIDSGVDFYLQKGGDPRAQFAELAHKIKKAVERRQVWETVRESESNYRELVENANTIILKWDRQGNITFFNEYAQRFFGYSPEEIIGKPLIGTIVPPTESGSSRDLSILIENIVRYPEDHVYNENENIRKNGERVWIQWWNKPLFDEKGDFTGLLSIGTNITERREFESALRESEDRYRVLVENAGIAICVIQGDKFRYVNPCAMEVCGYSRDEIMSRPFLDFAHPDDWDLIMDNHRRQLQGEKLNGPYTCRLMTKSGEARWFDIKSVPFTWEGKRATLSFCTDVSERENLEDALNQANKKLVLLSGITRHDILNQLTALEGYLELSEGHLEDPEKLREYLTREKAIAGILKRQILFTRDYEDLGVQSPKWQSVGDAFRHAGASFLVGEVCLRVPDETPEIFADPLFGKVCYNLIDNSLRYGGNGLTRISVGVQERREDLVIEYGDNGVGIAEPDKERVFDRGYGKNTGFGLFLSREILAITGISIRETGSPGAGVLFEIRVPKGKYRIKDFS
ncbi:MAG: PAS domain S-box protein [Methanoregulaceae archaeon]